MFVRVRVRVRDCLSARAHPVVSGVRAQVAQVVALPHRRGGHEAHDVVVHVNVTVAGDERVRAKVELERAFRNPRSVRGAFFWFVAAAFLAVDGGGLDVPLRDPRRGRRTRPLGVRVHEPLGARHVRRVAGVEKHNVVAAVGLGSLERPRAAAAAHGARHGLRRVVVYFGAFADASTVLVLLVLLVALLRVDDERLGQGRVRGRVFFADGILVPPQRRREIGFSRQRRDQQEPVRRGGSIQHAVPADIPALRPLQTSVARVIHVPVPPFEPETCESERGRRGGVSASVSCEYVFLGSNATSLAVKKRRGAHPSNASSRIRRS